MYFWASSDYGSQYSPRHVQGACTPLGPLQSRGNRGLGQKNGASRLAGFGQLAVGSDHRVRLEIPPRTELACRELRAAHAHRNVNVTQAIPDWHESANALQRWSDADALRRSTVSANDG